MATREEIDKKFPDEQGWKWPKDHYGADGKPRDNSVRVGQSIGKAVLEITELQSDQQAGVALAA